MNRRTRLTGFLVPFLVAGCVEDTYRPPITSAAEQQRTYEMQHIEQADAALANCLAMGKARLGESGMVIDAAVVQGNEDPDRVRKLALARPFTPHEKEALQALRQQNATCLHSYAGNLDQVNAEYGALIRELNAVFDELVARVLNDVLTVGEYNRFQGLLLAEAEKQWNAITAARDQQLEALHYQQMGQMAAMEMGAMMHIQNMAHDNFEGWLLRRALRRGGFW